MWRKITTKTRRTRKRRNPNVNPSRKRKNEVVSLVRDLFISSHFVFVCVTCPIYVQGVSREVATVTNLPCPFLPRITSSITGPPPSLSFSISSRYAACYPCPFRSIPFLSCPIQVPSLFSHCSFSPTTPTGVKTKQGRQQHH